MFEQIRKRLNPRNVHHVEGEAILSVRGLSVAYNGTTALQDISFEMDQGERVAVLGPNGAGKSTLFNVIAGVRRNWKGMVRVFGSEPGGHICIAYVPQRSEVDVDFPATVQDVVMMGRAGKIGYLRWAGRGDLEHVRSAIELVGMSGYENSQIGALSIGQRRRVFIAQALAQEADLVLMDEPLAGLDSHAQARIVEIMDMLTERRITLLVATHDFAHARAHYDRVLLLNGRLIAFDRPEIALAEANLRAAYGDHLHIIHAEQGETLLIEDHCHDC